MSLWNIIKIGGILLFLSVPSFGQERLVRLGFQLKDGAKKAVIPFEVHNNLIVVPVILNDALPLKFILDTGVRTAILTDRAISDLINLTYARKLTIYGVGGEKIVDAQIANNVTLELPGVRGKGHALFILEEDLLQLRNYLGTEIHGILGYELLSRFIVKFDFTINKMTIYDPAYFKPKKKFHEVKMTIEDTKPYITAPLSVQGNDTIQAKLMIDTGASHTLMLLSNDSVHFEVPSKHVESNLGRGLGGEIHGKVARIDFLSVGGFTMNNPIATFPDKDSYPDSTKMAFRTGTIGGGIITRFNIIFDYHSGLIYLKKNKDFHKPLDYNLSGMVFKADGIRLRTFIIDEVREGSPGDKAGLKEGDVLYKINNKPVSDMKFDNIVGFFNSRVDRRIHIEVFRGDKKIVTSLRLKRTL